ncbi:hypothetical protein M2405_004317 [Rhodococcus erythropolis]|uniref:hypothetical protein n=1 Tax=Rhodococcus erythropolis TaxID=1833 RepID=UPI0021699FA4|nr:hypothetical protein [Rhodococcus erythropolis]MCS4256014.1 hypothetical protein [Rhodococcus erythropolis]MCW2425531.1 hypothetical protein [Rhodococcus erythropolis]
MSLNTKDGENDAVAWSEYKAGHTASSDLTVRGWGIGDFVTETVSDCLDAGIEVPGWVLATHVARHLIPYFSCNS